MLVLSLSLLFVVFEHGKIVLVGLALGAGPFRRQVAGFCASGHSALGVAIFRVVDIAALKAGATHGFLQKFSGLGGRYYGRIVAGREIAAAKKPGQLALVKDIRAMGRVSTLLVLLFLRVTKNKAWPMRWELVVRKI